VPCLAKSPVPETFAKKYGVIFEVRSSLNDNPGTLVLEEHPAMEDVVIRGITVEHSQAPIINDIPDEPDMPSKTLGALAEAEINIDMILSTRPQSERACREPPLPQHTPP
jgi:aspartate kinase